MKKSDDTVPPAQSSDDEHLGDDPAAGPEALPILTPLNATIDVSTKTNDELEKLNKFKRQASNLVRSHVELIPDMDDEDRLSAALKATAAGLSKGKKSTEQRTASTYVAIVYDVKLSGESSCRPHLRLPNFRVKHAEHLVKVAMKLKSVDELDEGDLYIFPDGGKHGRQLNVCRWALLPHALLFPNATCVNVSFSL